MTLHDPHVSEAATPARFTAEEFSRMIDADVFGGRAVELVHGEIIELSPAHSSHGQMMAKVLVRLSSLFGEERLLADIYTRLDDDSMRGFDVVVLSQPVEGNRAIEPAEILLGVEIAYSSAPRDLGEKMRHYAASGVQTYMVVEIGRSIAHLMTGPQADGYADHLKFAFGAPIPLPEGAGTLVID